MIEFNNTGDFSKTMSFLEKAKECIHIGTLDRYGRRGVELLKESTPKDTGKTSESWTYEINRNKDSVTLTFSNSNIQNGENIAILLQYGHGTRNGGYVVGRDYINPTIQPLFDEIANSAWKEVTK